MNRQQIYEQIRKKKSFLCVGLDTDINKIPDALKKEEDPVFAFNKAIIDATADLAVAYKPNTAFYESLGPDGMESLRKTIAYIPDEIFVIADAKRGDIGNTSAMYARSYFEYFKADAITVAPYMGSDSVKPFLQYKDKWVIILALTSNEGSQDFQQLTLSDGSRLYQKVLNVSSHYGDVENTMFVVGATRASHLSDIRRVVPDHFLLVPGVGAQGGNLDDVCTAGINKMGGLLINASRSILYASSADDYADAARNAALSLRNKMAAYIG